MTILCSHSSISHHRYDPIFATASSTIEIWDETKTSPLSTLKFHSTSSLSTGEHIVCVAFNKSETSVLASSGSDRTVCLYDLRSGKAIGRVAMNVSSFVSLISERILKKFNQYRCESTLLSSILFNLQFYFVLRKITISILSIFEILVRLRRSTKVTSARTLLPPYLDTITTYSIRDI